MSSGVRRSTGKGRLLLGVLSNSYGQLVTTSTQLLSFPVFLSIWTIELFGVWLTISAIPVYFALSDFGLVGVAGTRMTMLMAVDEKLAARIVLRSVTVALVAGGLAVIGTVALVVALMDDAILPADSGFALVLLIVGVVVAQFGGLSEAVLRSIGKYAVGTGIGSTIRLFEWVGWVVGLHWIGTLGGVALVGLLCRIVGTLASLGYSGKVGPFGWGWRSASAAEVRVLLRPALGTVSITAGSAIALQGVSLVVAAVFGSAAVVVFNAYRTVSRTVVQAVTIFGNALWPELSRLYAVGPARAFRRIVVRSSVAAVVAAGVLGVACVFSMSPVLVLWTGGDVPYEEVLALLFGFYAFFAGAWQVPRTALVAANRHGSLGITALFIGGALVVASFALGTSTSSLSSVVMLMIVSEVSMGFAALVLLRRSVFQPEKSPWRLGG